MFRTRTLSFVLVALAALLGGCISTEYIGADGTKVRSTRIMLVPPVSYTPIYGTSGGYRYQPGDRHFVTNCEPTFDRFYDGRGNMVRMVPRYPAGCQR